MSNTDKFYFIVKDKRYPNRVISVSQAYETKDGASFMARHMREQLDPQRDKADYENIYFTVIKSHGRNDREVLKNAKLANKPQKKTNKLKYPKMNNSTLNKLARRK